MSDERPLRILIGVASAPEIYVGWRVAIDEWAARASPAVELRFMYAWSANHSINFNRLISTAKLDPCAFFGSLETDVIPEVDPDELAAILLEHHAEGRHVVGTGLALRDGTWGFDPGNCPPPDGSHPFFPVDYTNLGFTFVSRQALAGLKPIYTIHTRENDFELFAADVDQEPMRVGLDYSFSWRLRRRGFQPWIDRRIRTTHGRDLKRKSWGWDDRE